MGFDCWLDQNAATITKESMKLGVASSQVFLIFLSEGVLTRPFCLFEIETALEMKKPLMLMHETDRRHGKALRTTSKLSSLVLRLPVAEMIADTPLCVRQVHLTSGLKRCEGHQKPSPQSF